MKDPDRRKSILEALEKASRFIASLPEGVSNWAERAIRYAERMFLALVRLALLLWLLLAASQALVTILTSRPISVKQAPPTIASVPPTKAPDRTAADQPIVLVDIPAPANTATPWHLESDDG